MELEFRDIKGRIERDFPLAPLTWLNVGGRADLYYESADQDDLVSLLTQVPPNVSVFYMGKGSNLLISDQGFRGIVIRLGRSFSWIRTIDETSFEAGAFSSPASIARYTLKHSLSGCEFFSHLPGSLGGAVKMNAGSFNQETGDIINSVKLMDRKGQCWELGREECAFKYRSSSIGDEQIVISAVMKCKPGKRSSIEKLMEQQKAKRKASQPVDMKTTGSFFKNPAEGPAAKLIDQCGLKAYRIGGAMVSEKHANFFVNTGKATAADFIELSTIVRKRVFEEYGVTLIPEVKFLPPELDQ